MLSHGVVNFARKEMRHVHDASALRENYSYARHGPTLTNQNRSRTPSRGETPWPYMSLSCCSFVVDRFSGHPFVFVNAQKNNISTSEICGTLLMIFVFVCSSTNRARAFRYSPAYFLASRRLDLLLIPSFCLLKTGQDTEKLLCGREKRRGESLHP